MKCPILMWAYAMGGENISANQLICDTNCGWYMGGGCIFRSIESHLRGIEAHLSIISANSARR